jgi:hypothetical protein
MEGPAYLGFDLRCSKDVVLDASKKEKSPKAGHYEAAKAFRDWVASEDSRAILKKYGFSLPEDARRQPRP